MTLLGFSQSQSQWTDRAFVYVEQDSLVQAEECFRQAVELASSSEQKALLLANLGTVQRRSGRMHEALVSYTQALALVPMNTMVLMHRATVYMALGNDDKAYADLCNVLDREPNNVDLICLCLSATLIRH